MKTNLAYLLIILISKNLNACEVGQYDKAGTCTDCPVHEFSTTTDATECTKCPIGSEQATVKSMICTKCPVGKSNTAAGTACASSKSQSWQSRLAALIALGATGDSKGLWGEYQEQ